MRRKLLRGCCLLLVLGAAVGMAAQAAPTPQPAPTIWTWDQVKDLLRLNNTTLLAGVLNIEELKAEEITAFLRPNPQLSVTVDGTQIAPKDGRWPVFAGTYEVPGISYLIERRRKRPLRLQAAKEGTAIGIAQQDDLERNTLFNLRGAFVGTLQAKAVVQVAKENLDYYDHVLKISRDRYEAGDIAQIDLDRLELQRVQYESDLQTAIVNLRTSKINLLLRILRQPLLIKS